MPFCYDMVRKLMVCSLFFLRGMCLFAIGDARPLDKVIMKIGDEKVYLSEFEFMYSNLGKYLDCSKDEYFHYFSRYKLKSFDARRLGLDKDLDNTIKDAILKEISPIIAASEDSFGSLPIYLLTYRVCQNEDTSRGLKFMEEVYSKLESGIKVCNVCNGISDERFSCEEILNDDYLLNEIRNVLLRFHESGHSKPFISPEGIHILVKYTEALEYNLENSIDDVFLVSLWNKFYTDYLRKYSEDDLKDFFKENRKKYRWEFPHFKGAVIHCKNKKAAKKIRKKIKKQPIEKWSETIESLKSENPDYDALVDAGLFQIGENVYIDKLVFKCGGYKTLDNYPYTFTIGKCLDYMPETYKDVYGVLLQDYFLEYEDTYFEGLERNLRVEKYIDVLKTVNSDGSN